MGSRTQTEPERQQRSVVRPRRFTSVLFPPGMESPRRAQKPRLHRRLPSAMGSLRRGELEHRVRLAVRLDGGPVQERVLALCQLEPEPFAALEDYARRRASFAEPVLARFASEAHFYLAYLDHIAPLEAAGLSFCLPELSIAGEERHSHSFAHGAFDMVLAAKLIEAGGRVVVNDFELTGDECFLVVTGPNHGGKTTYARAFGQLHHLAALGLPVPAARAAE